MSALRLSSPDKLLVVVGEVQDPLLDLHGAVQHIDLERRRALLRGLRGVRVPAGVRLGLEADSPGGGFGTDEGVVFIWVTLKDWSEPH